jgi:hypothetical protein
MSVKSATAFGLSSGLEPGMVLLNTTSFSGVSSQIISNVFSASYDNYEICFNNITATADSWVAIQMRAGSTTETSSNYYMQGLYAYSGTASASRNTSMTSWLNVHYVQTTAVSNTSILRVTTPFQAKPTMAINPYSVSGNSTSAFEGGMRIWSLNTNTSYDSFVISGGTFTGSISVYGYNK